MLRCKRVVLPNIVSFVGIACTAASFAVTRLQGLARLQQAVSEMKTSESAGQIVAMGGGGFSAEADNTRMDDWILSLSPRQPARVCFIPTASGDSPEYLVKFYRAFSGRAVATDLTLTDAPAMVRRP